MPRWKASLISGVVAAAGFYVLSNLETRNNKSFQKKATLETAQQNYRIVDEPITKPTNHAKVNQGQIVSKSKYLKL